MVRGSRLDDFMTACDDDQTPVDASGTGMSLCEMPWKRHDFV
jgi:hypothetical protein